ncbi:hypothetical protein [Nocardiopsis suaedae]|uniref:Uncharacterized protein n=1 Tax=Nocardiopsis suaedae TaxID=3018444 RepID=A0ABT4TJH8_9ACTN|nr:hypothetical protein [Nocardiopsis suaedae]MDA2804848.1 hypothetical protein [Nocardiopsis suaedae]
MPQPLSPTARALRPAVLLTGAWFAAVLAAAAAGAFPTPGDFPPVAIGLAVAVPPGVAVWSAVASQRFRDWARSLDLRFLTLLQTWRCVGLAFIALAAIDALPGGFALPAGYGDVFVGVTAPLVALYVIGRGRLGQRIYLAWTAFGVLDLLNAVAMGVLFSDNPIGLLATGIDTDLMEELPMVLIPTFGVPLTLILHLISAINVIGNPATRQAQENASVDGPVPERI